MNTLLYEYIERLKLGILVHSDRAPADAEWTPYATMLQEKYMAGALRRVFVFGDGPGPNARQRQLLRYRARDDLPLDVAVISHSLVTRGIVAALSWFFEIRAFPPFAIDEAFEYLKIPRSDWLMVRTSVGHMRVRLCGTSPVEPPFELTEVIGSLDEVVVERLPRLRARVEQARSSARGR